MILRIFKLLENYEKYQCKIFLTQGKQGHHGNQGEGKHQGHQRQHGHQWLQGHREFKTM